MLPRRRGASIKSKRRCRSNLPAPTRRRFAPSAIAASFEEPIRSRASPWRSLAGCPILLSPEPASVWPEHFAPMFRAEWIEIECVRTAIWLRCRSSNSSSRHRSDRATPSRRVVCRAGARSPEGPCQSFRSSKGNRAIGAAAPGLLRLR